jgi:hypothetical protein
MIVGNVGAVDYKALWERTKKAARELPGAAGVAAEKVFTQKAVEVVAPAAQEATVAKAKGVLSAGNVVLFTLGGLAAGALVAGPTWKRRAIGSAVGGALGAVVGWKLGWARAQII